MTDKSMHASPECLREIDKIFADLFNNGNGCSWSEMRNGVESAHAAGKLEGLEEACAILEKTHFGDSALSSVGAKLRTLEALRSRIAALRQK